MTITVKGGTALLVTYRTDEIPRTKKEFLDWCKRRLWEDIERAKVYDAAFPESTD